MEVPVNDRAIRKLVDQVTETVLVLRTREQIEITDKQAKERARSIVQLFLPLLEEREEELLARIRSIADAVRQLGSAHETIERSADTVNRELEELLAGTPCEVCGRQIRDGEGAFEPADHNNLASRLVITCGRCDEGKERAS
jgi:DNA repair exonuclease SbcCD ATPase subunit